MTATEALERRIDELCAENKKLRQDNDRLIGRSFRTADKMNCLNIENAKLRGLVKHLRECTRHNTCAACEYADDACDFDYDMRELGIEVDG